LLGKKQSDSVLENLLAVRWEDVASDISEFILAQVPKEKNGVVIGISGGVDSACTLALCCKSIGPQKILALILPDSRVTPNSDVEDSRALCKQFGVAREEHDISTLHEGFMKNLPSDSFAEGNLRARIRMSVLYYYANLQNRLVCGTGDRSESLIGYFTKYGDGGVDFLPIGNLYKCQVRALANFLGIPSHVYLKPSSPHLWVGHSAEAELGITYDEIDTICHLLFDKKLSASTVSSRTGLPKSKVDHILALNRASAHKRQFPPIPKPPSFR
jgi:NAD+ synthase